MKKQLDQLINNNSVLTSSNQKLVDLNERLHNHNQEHINRYSSMLHLCGNIYKILTTKKNKTWEEEAWCKELYQEITSEIKKNTP